MICGILGEIWLYAARCLFKLTDRYSEVHYAILSIFHIWNFLWQVFIFKYVHVSTKRTCLVLKRHLIPILIAVLILYTHVCKWKSETCWNYSRNGRRGIKGNDGRGEFVIYLIHCKNFCKYHHVLPAQQQKKMLTTKRANIR
jgi:hypothetical protein